MYVVQRKYGKFGKDFLHAFDAQWGTACMGSPALALRFETLEHAQAAAERATRECRGAGGLPVQGVCFEPVDARNLPVRVA